MRERTERPNNIEKLRLAKGWTMQQLADKMDTQRAQINKLEKGHIQLKEFWLIKLSKALECNISDILLSCEQTNRPDQDIPVSQIFLKIEELLQELKQYLSSSSDETTMLELFRSLTKEQQTALLNLAKSFIIKKNTPPPPLYPKNKFISDTYPKKQLVKFLLYERTLLNTPCFFFNFSDIVICIHIGYIKADTTWNVKEVSYEKNKLSTFICL